VQEEAGPVHNHERFDKLDNTRKYHSHPKNIIEAIVAVAARTTATTPSTINTTPKARSHPQLWIISGVAPIITSIEPFMSALLSLLKISQE
jgi:hypothetical protein